METSVSRLPVLAVKWERVRHPAITELTRTYLSVGGKKERIENENNKEKKKELIQQTHLLTDAGSLLAETDLLLPPTPPLPVPSLAGHLDPLPDWPYGCEDEEDGER